MNKIVAVLIAMSFWTLSLLCTVTVYAQDAFQIEISADYIKLEADDNFESKLYGVYAEVFFLPVKTANHPLAEAAFLERIGSVELFGGKYETQGATSKADGPVYRALATFMKPGSALFAEALYYRLKLEADPPSTTNWAADAYGLGIGSFFSDGLLLGIRYFHSKSETTGPFSSMTKFDDYEMHVKNVSVNADGTALNIEGNAGLRRTDDGSVVESNIAVGVSGDYYFTRQVSAGVGIEVETGENRWDEGVTASINVNAYANQSFSAKMAYEKFSAHHETVPDDDLINVTVSVRF